MLRFVGAVIETINLAPVLLRDLLREVTDQTTRKGIRVEYKFDSNLGPLDVGRALLGEALCNVISNAVEATPDGGTITLSTRVCGDGFAEISASGTMDVQTAVGTGTTVRIRLPLSPVPRHVAGAQVPVHSSVLK